MNPPDPITITAIFVAMASIAALLVTITRTTP